MSMKSQVLSMSVRTQGRVDVEPPSIADSLRECATSSPRAWQAVIDAAVDNIEDEVVEIFFFELSAQCWYVAGHTHVQARSLILIFFPRRVAESLLVLSNFTPFVSSQCFVGDNVTHVWSTKCYNDTSIFLGLVPLTAAFNPYVLPPSQFIRLTRISRSSFWQI
jgi:hypothetical protein